MDVEKQGVLPSENDAIRSLTVKKDDEKIVLDGGDEGDKLLKMARTVRELDPDLIFTDGGDSFILPYLAKRAQASGIAEQFSLDRESSPLLVPSRAGTSYFSYGKILYKPSTMKLKGRVHIDVANSFVCADTGLQGLFELSRICRMPLHTSSRATIGRALSSLQFYNAYKQDVLVPWKPTLAETPKDRVELLIADRGGFTFEPRLGLYEDVAEYDFQCVVPEHHAEEEHLRGDRQVHLLPRLDQQGPRARLERLPEKDGHRPSVDGDRRGQAAALQEAQKRLEQDARGEGDLRRKASSPKMDWSHVISAI